MNLILKCLIIFIIVLIITIIILLIINAQIFKYLNKQMKFLVKHLEIFYHLLQIRLVFKKSLIKLGNSRVKHLQQWFIFVLS
ncbi:unnamed protein product [Trichobilharzia regenti]|nr:unnamed protein product [Trichobilharzia regenti]